VAELKPVYLVCGDDDAKIDAWRARLRRRAEEEHGPGGLERFDGSTHDPETVAAALATLTFSTGTRYLLVDDVGSWKAAALAPLEAALASPTPDTVLVLIVRGKPLKALAKAVESAGGELREHEAPKPWQMPKWLVARAKEAGLQLDAEAAKALVASVGGQPQRLSRELEKLELAVHPNTAISLDDVEELSPAEASARAYDLADALVAGDHIASVRLAADLRAQEERPGGLLYPITRRLREVHRAAALLERGLPEQKAVEAVGGPPWLAKKTVAAAKRADREALERATCVFADLEIELRGGLLSPTAVDEDTAFSRALERAAARH
jgi:DNA polymerase-3 subunit delta